MRGLLAATAGGLITVLAALSATPAGAITPALPRVPPNFEIEAYAHGLDPVGALLVLPGGDLVVAEGDHVSLLRGAAASGVADSEHVLVSGLDHPVGLALHRDKLLVATADSILTCRYLVGRVRLAGACHRLVDLVGDGRPLPGGLTFNRDESVLYVALAAAQGAPTLLAMRADGKGRHAVSSSAHQPAALALEPSRGGLWALDRGSSPPALVAVGAAVPPAALPVAATPVSIAFYARDRYPKAYRGGLFIADRGAAPEREPALLFAPFRDGQPSGAIEEFVGGLSPGALAVTRDGAVIVADDTSHTLWRIAFKCGACTPDPVTPQRLPAHPRKH